MNQLYVYIYSLPLELPLPLLGHHRALSQAQMEPFLRKSRMCKAHSCFIHLVNWISLTPTMEKLHWLVERLSVWVVERSGDESQLWLWLSHFIFETQFPYLCYKGYPDVVCGNTMKNARIWVRHQYEAWHTVGPQEADVESANHKGFS